jgi:hypothetical protein
VQVQGKDHRRGCARAKDEIESKSKAEGQGKIESENRFEGVGPKDRMTGGSGARGVHHV